MTDTDRQHQPANHYRRYSPRVVARILAALDARKPLTVIAKQFRRKPSAINYLANMYGYAIRQERTRCAGMSVADVAAALGVHHMTVRRWIIGGGLPSVRSATDGRWTYHSIDPDALIAWLRAGNVYRTMLRPTDPIWQAEIAAIRADLRWLSIFFLADLLCCSRQLIGQWIATGILPQPCGGGYSAFPAHWSPADVSAWLQAHPERQTAAARAWMQAEEARG